MKDAAGRGRPWTFLGTHGQVLLCLGRSPDPRIRDVADRLGITGRAVQMIIRDLAEAGYLTCRRVGRRNRYEIHIDRPMRHPLVAHREVGALLELLGPESGEADEE